MNTALGKRRIETPSSQLFLPPSSDPKRCFTKRAQELENVLVLLLPCRLDYPETAVPTNYEVSSKIQLRPVHACSPTLLPKIQNTEENEPWSFFQKPDSPALCVLLLLPCPKQKNVSTSKS
jgi:hypothetical protein